MLERKSDQQLWDEVTGCTDGGCQIVTASGMCTNGGCTCIPRFSTKFKHIYSFEDRKRLIQAFHGYKAKVRLLEQQLTDANREIEGLKHNLFLAVCYNQTNDGESVFGTCGNNITDRLCDAMTCPHWQRKGE